MEADKVAKFKKILLDLKESIQKQSIDTGRLQSTEKITEDYEVASLITEQATITKLLSRKALYLNKIEAALLRIKEGYYGECDGCGENINPKRLEARPTAEYCIACKEVREKEERTLKSTGILDLDLMGD